MAEIYKRIFTSILLLSLLYLAYNYKFILLLSLILVFFQIIFETQFILKKILKKKKFIILILLKLIIIYLFFILFYIWNTLSSIHLENKIELLFILTICISSDVGGYVFGKLFKGKKLTKISPNKTYSGLIGSYLSSLSVSFLIFKSYISIDMLILLALIISTVSQIGDLYISFLKRKSKIKDTDKILPGHGGLLDRFDGLIFAIPLGYMLFEII